MSVCLWVENLSDVDAVYVPTQLGPASNLKLHKPFLTAPCLHTKLLFIARPRLSRANAKKQAHTPVTEGGTAQVSLLGPGTPAVAKICQMLTIWLRVALLLTLRRKEPVPRLCARQLPLQTPLTAALFHFLYHLVTLPFLPSHPRSYATHPVTARR